MELIFLGSSCNYNKVWLYLYKRYAPEKLCPWFSLNPLICKAFFLPKKNLNLVFPVPPPPCTISTSISFSALTNRHPTPCPSLQACVLTASFLLLFLSAGPALLEQHWKWNKPPLSSPVEKGAAAEMLLCGHQKPLPGLAAFVCWQTAGVSSASPVKLLTFLGNSQFLGVCFF